MSGAGGGRGRAAWQMVNINRKLFEKCFRVDLAIVAIGTLYICGGGSGVRLGVSRAVILVFLFLFFAVVETQVIRRNSPGLTFFLQLPFERKRTLALFYLPFTLPAVAALIVAATIGRVVAPLLGVPVDPDVAAGRFAEVLFSLLFIKSFTVNNMILVSIQYMLVAVHMLVLGLFLLALLIVKDYLSDVYVMSGSLFVALFLATTYAFSFVLEKGVEI